MEYTNRDLCTQILKSVGRSLAITTGPDRLGHDRRYALDPSALKATGWAPAIPWASGLDDCVQRIARQLHEPPDAP